MRSILDRHNDVMRTLQSRLATIEREGEGRPQWKQEERTAALEKARQASIGIKAELKTYQADQEAKKREAFLNSWKGLDHRTFTHVPSESLYWQNMAAAAFNGKANEKRLEAYDYIVKSMNERERILYRHIVDQHLRMQVFGDAADELVAEKAINQKRSQKEKESQRDLLKVERIGDFIPTLTGIFEANYTEIEAGEKPVNDPLKLLDEIEKDTAAEMGEGAY